MIDNHYLRVFGIDPLEKGQTTMGQTYVDKPGYPEPESSHINVQAKPDPFRAEAQLKKQLEAQKVAANEVECSVRGEGLNSAMAALHAQIASNGRRVSELEEILGISRPEVLSGKPEADPVPENLVYGIISFVDRMRERCAQQETDIAKIRDVLQLLR